MANEEHLAILRQGVEVWNKWREKHAQIMPDLSACNLRGAELCEVNFQQANLINVDLSGANLRQANLGWADLTEGKLWKANLNVANLSQADLSSADINQAELAGADLRNSNLRQVNLSMAILQGSDLSMADLSKSILSRTDITYTNCRQADFSESYLGGTQALFTNFQGANFTGACIEDWNINEETVLHGIDCQYFYRKWDKLDRCPSSGNFEPGDFAKLVHKSLNTIDLIFRNGIDWDAFTYSFKKLEVENQGAQLDVQSIEKKGDGILVVRVAVSPDANKAEIHSDFMQGYEFAAKALEAQYQERLEDKEKVINQLFSTINQQNKLLAQTGDKVSIYYQPNSQFAGGIVDANTVNADQIGGNIQNNDA